MPRRRRSSFVPYTTLFRSALDLRKYGRSLREHQTPGFITDLSDYDPEIELALAAIRDRHGGGVRIVGMGHSTGGLILDRKSTRLNSSHVAISYAVFCLNKK